MNNNYSIIHNLSLNFFTFQEKFVINIKINTNGKGNLTVTMELSLEITFESQTTIESNMVPVAKNWSNAYQCVQSLSGLRDNSLKCAATTKSGHFTDDNDNNHHYIMANDIMILLTIEILRPVCHKDCKQLKSMLVNNSSVLKSENCMVCLIGA